MKAVAALITTILTAVGALVGLPVYISPELIALVASAITGAFAVYFYIRANKSAPAA